MPSLNINCPFRILITWYLRLPTLIMPINLSSECRFISDDNLTIQLYMTGFRDFVRTINPHRLKHDRSFLLLCGVNYDWRYIRNIIVYWLFGCEIKKDHCQKNQLEWNLYCFSVIIIFRNFVLVYCIFLDALFLSHTCTRMEHCQVWGRL